MKDWGRPCSLARSSISLHTVSAKLRRSSSVLGSGGGVAAPAAIGSRISKAAMVSRLCKGKSAVVADSFCR